MIGMREQIARHLRAQWVRSDTWDSASLKSKEAFFALADVALACLEKPTEGMLLAAVGLNIPSSSKIAHHYGFVFEDMIKAAREGK